MESQKRDKNAYSTYDISTFLVSVSSMKNKWKSYFIIVWRLIAIMHMEDYMVGSV